MNRPEIAQFFPADTTPADIQKDFTACPELYRYIMALDVYVDWLIDIPNTDAINHRAMQVEIFQKAMQADQDELGLHVINTPYGDLKFKRLNLLGPEEIFIETKKHGQ